ncbi:MAG TPA: hypothetical protein DC024_13950 [Clostridiales bacterium]|jgi:hypothetical protein|nr:hypothetical protein [Clostridiales bacterium]
METNNSESTVLKYKTTKAPARPNGRVRCFYSKGEGRDLKLKHIIKIMKKESGQAMVEFALVLPILLLLIGGIIDFGWIFHNQLATNNASREAARFIAIHYYSDDMDDKDSYAAGSAERAAFDIMKDNTLIELDIDDIEEIIEPIVPIADAGGLKIDVKFTGKVKILTPILRAFTEVFKDNEDGMYVIKAQTTMRVEQ